MVTDAQTAEPEETGKRAQVACWLKGKKGGGWMMTQAPPSGTEGKCSFHKVLLGQACSVGLGGSHCCHCTPPDLQPQGPGWLPQEASWILAVNRGRDSYAAV